MLTHKHIVVIAGEESGDMHAASFIKVLKLTDPALRISGIGGIYMQACGIPLISDLANYGVTGVTEVVRHFSLIRKAMIAIKQHLALTKPDLLILVDYPGFNLRLAKFAKCVLGLKIIYYISPQIWAWKANRIKKIRCYIDKMAVIFPFEKDLYQKANVDVSFVGHPLLDNLPYFTDLKQLRYQLQLPINKKVVALLPGSRHNELINHLPTMISAAEKFSQKDVHFVVAIAKSLDPEIVKAYFKTSSLTVTFVVDATLASIACSDCVVVASGTASLECALLQKPMCIVYKTSQLTYTIATRVIKVKYLGLCNLLSGQMIVPELIQHDFNITELTKIIGELLTNPVVINTMIKKLALLKQSLSLDKADESISTLIKAQLI